MRKYLNWKFWLGLLISAFFLWLALRKIEMPRLWQAIQSARLSDILLVTGLYLVQYLIRILRWAIFLDPLKQTGFSNRLHATFIGFGANCILPAHLGELVRAKYLGLLEGMSAGSVMGSIVVERLFDCVLLMLIFLIGIATTPFPQEGRMLFDVLRNTALAGGVLLLLIIALVLCKTKMKTLGPFLTGLLGFLSEAWRNRIHAVVTDFFSGLMPLKNAGAWARAFLYSCLLWGLALYQVDLIEHALGLDLPFKATFFIMALATLGVLIPSSPGYIGTFHYAVQLGFLVYGIDQAEALSAAILLHATTFFPTLILGLISFCYVRRLLRQSNHPGA